MFFIVLMMLLLIFILFFMSCLFWSSEEHVSSISSTEAGFFANKKSSQGSYSLQFVIILFIFIAFDLELLFVGGVLFKSNIIMLIFLLGFILGSFFIEWGLSKMKWMV